jgi:hypothetical protein
VDRDAEEEFTINSEHAYVASTKIACRECHSQIEVICIYCDSGVVADEPLTQFTVSGVWAMDDTLARQLGRWPTFKKEQGRDGSESRFANHCPHCGALQDDLDLHSEPDQPFFSIPRASPGSIRLSPLIGEVRFSGDESFEI